MQNFTQEFFKLKKPIILSKIHARVMGLGQGSHIMIPKKTLSSFEDFCCMQNLKRQKGPHFCQNPH
jgi:hypothetical protein